jgi:hypothetical protein
MIVTPTSHIASAGGDHHFRGSRGGALTRRDGTLLPRRWRTERWSYWKAGGLTVPPRSSGEDVDNSRWSSDLGFLDEATALAAGHRPCEIQCVDDARRFALLWSSIVSAQGSVRFAEIDAQLHRERLDSDLRKRMLERVTSELPSAAMVSGPAGSYLHLAGRFFLWSTRGYVGEWKPPGGHVFRVLTPETVLRVLAAGFEPDIHESLLDLL